MKALIQDRESLQAIGPLELMSYLRSRGWTKEADVGDKASLWVNTLDTYTAEVAVPLRRDFRDYAIRIAEVLRSLEQVENRSQLEVFRDVQTNSSDLIRLRASTGTVSDGSLPIDDGVQFVSQARDLVLAAACATVMPRPHWPRRRPPQALQYLRAVRLGQTEHGSFVLSILSPVPPSLHSPDATEWNPSPFERKVTETLQDALISARSAALMAAASGNVEPFSEAIDRGVSANLCDALVGLAKVNTDTTAVDIEISWAPTRRSTRTYASITFSKDEIPWLEQASLFFKKTAPPEAMEIVGFVGKLEKLAGEPIGTVRVDGITEKGPQKVFIDLGDSDYHVAVHAHDRELPVRCTGELVKDGRSYRLRNPQDFALYGPESD
jgi:hypothetical protein